MKYVKTYAIFESEGREVVTFDFDGVLHTGIIPGTIHPLPRPEAWTPNLVMIEKLREEAVKHDIYIVTARDGDSQGRNIWIEKFVKDNNLPVKGIICTFDAPKLPYLEELGSIRHYDDNKKMIKQLEGSGIEFILVDPTANLIEK